ncbi:MAG: glycosyltransferase family 4 protein [Isosphaeraceae bacterium]|nr:glycosyltransferase family 4 protein [Isosphaeraceae bacterium]
MNRLVRDRPLRILFAHYLNDETHAAARMVHSISDELRGFGHEVLVHRSIDEVYRSASSTGSSPEVARRSLTSRIRNKFWFARTLTRNAASYQRDQEAIRRFRPDVILGREDAYRFSIVQAARRAGIPLVTYADAPVAYETRLFHSEVHWHPPGLVEAMERWWLDRSRAVITPCRPSADTLRRLGSRTPIHVVPNGVDPIRFAPLETVTRRRVKHELGIPEGRTVVGFQGSFRRFHGIDLLLEMMLGTAGRDDLHWVLIGDGPERQRLQAAVEGRMAASFLGRQPAERMGELVGAMEIATATHMKLEGSFYFCPLKILEYAASGCAIIASAQGDIPYLLEEGRSGLILEDCDPKQWIAALDSLLIDPSRRARLGRNAREWVAGNLTWRDCARRVETILFDVLEVEPSGRVSTPPRFHGAVTRSSSAAIANSN